MKVNQGREETQLLKIKNEQNFPKDGVVISASGGHVTKAVSTVELVKRSYAVNQIISIDDT